MPVRPRWLLLALLGVVLAVLVAVAVRPSGVRPDESPGTPPPAVPSAAPAEPAVFYGSRTPYPTPAGSAAVPAGLVPVFVEHLGRHGARTSTSGDEGERAGRLWRRAAAAGALTPLGTRLGPVLDVLDAATARIGPGLLTTVGRAEQQSIGRREGVRLAPLFAQAEEAGASVRVVTSGRTRAEQSAAGFVAGLTEVWPALDVRPARTDRRLLYFDHTDAAYRDFLASDRTWRPAYTEAVRGAELEATSTALLERLYTPAFVGSLADPVAEAEGVYERYRGAPALAQDLASPVDMTPFVLPAAAATFAFVEDARYFYSRGPGVAGDDRSYRAARVLLDDFFTAADERLAGGRTVAVFRFAHAEELAPFAALLALPGSRPLASARQVYGWGTSDFRTARVVPLSGNIRWTVWRDGTGTALVSVDQDEVPTELGRSCRAEPDRPGFYRLDELRRCLPD